MKYIVFSKKMQRGGMLTYEMPIMFPNHLIHADVAASMTAKGAPLEGYKVVSAGEYTPMSGECSGKSETLSKKSRVGDSALILMHDYGAGIK